MNARRNIRLQEKYTIFNLKGIEVALKLLGNIKSTNPTTPENGII